MWDRQTLDSLTEFVVARLLVDRASARVVAAELVDRLIAQHPQLSAASAALPFTIAAGSIEEILGAGAEAQAAALDAWRVAALIGADALMIEAQQGAAGSIGDLHQLWQAGDDVFGGQ